MRREQTRQRDAQVFRLRTRGWPLRRIADEMGFAGPSGVHAAIHRARAEIERPAAQFQRDHACDHLDQLSERA